MTDVVYCDLCKEQETLTSATVAFRVQRDDDPDATPQSVRCCDPHEGQGAAVAALMRRNLAPATVSRSVLRGAATERSATRAALRVRRS